MKAFDLFRPKDLFQAFSPLELNQHETVLKSGGTDLLIWIKKGLVSPKEVVDLSSIDSLNEIEVKEGEGILIGTNVSLNRIIDHPEMKRRFPALIEACETHSDAVLRNKATLVGNVCSAVPSGDTIPPLLCYEAEAVVQTSCSKRHLPLPRLIIGPRKKSISKTEIVTHLWIPLLKADLSVGAYRRASRRRALDLAQAAVACTLFQHRGERDFRLAVGALSPIPVRVSEGERILNETSNIDEKIADRVADAVLKAIQPITDVRGSREFRFAVTVELVRESLSLCLTRAKTEEGCY